MIQYKNKEFRELAFTNLMGMVKTCQLEKVNALGVNDPLRGVLAHRRQPL